MLHQYPHTYDNDEPIVDISGMTCGYDGNPVLSDMNLQIMRGDFVGLLGPSGSGKTSLLRSILGAIDIYEGSVTVEGWRRPGPAPAAES